MNAPRLVRVSEPASEPITRAEAKLWLKLDSDSTDDALIDGLIASARALFEEHTGRTLLATTYRAEWDQLPRVGAWFGAPIGRMLELPRAPLVADSPIAWVRYLDAAGVEQTMSNADYAVDAGRDPARYPRLWLHEAADWPELGSFPGALRVQFVAGYGDTAAAVPEEIKVCLKLLVAHLYQNRTPVNIGNIVNELPWSLQHLVSMHTIRSIA